MLSTPTRMKCGCSMKKDMSLKVFGKKAEKAGDWTYCPKHGDGRLDVDRRINHFVTRRIERTGDED